MAINILKRAGLKAAEQLSGALGHEVAPKFIDTLPEMTQQVIGKVRPYTMTSDRRLAALCDAVQYVVKRGIPGDIVECGVWKGGSSMAAAECLLRLGSTERHIYMYDTFDGMSEPTEFDKEIDSGRSAADMMAATDKSDSVWAYSGIDEVKSNLAQVAYPKDQIHLIQGKVEETIPGTIPTQISILRLDTDWYESTAHELKHLYPLLSPGGVLIIDDYGHWDGARRAVDEYFSGTGQAVLLSRVDYTGRMTLKV
jgi:O-methyltransferase